jgi:CBS domain-containing protein
MLVSEILRIKGKRLISAHPDQTVQAAVQLMASEDIGSLVVLAEGCLVGMLSFREVMRLMAQPNQTFASLTVAAIMDKSPTQTTPQMDIAELRKLMLARHARYVPVLDGGVLLGVLSFHDVAKAVINEQDFENNMLKQYINDGQMAMTA